MLRCASFVNGAARNLTYIISLSCYLFCYVITCLVFIAKVSDPGQCKNGPAKNRRRTNVTINPLLISHHSACALYQQVRKRR